jgi:hypothetical protein
MHHKHSTTEPFYRMQLNEDGTSSAMHDVALAEQTIEKMQKFDADENVFIVIAHDASLMRVVDFFPKGANDWKNKGWKEKGRWGFLKDFMDQS